MPQPGPTDAILLLSHGSSDAAAIAEVHRFVDYFRRRSGMSNVFLGFLEVAEPSIPAVIQQIAATGARRIRALPLFLFPGRHVLSDLPRILGEARAAYPQLEIDCGEALIFNPKLVDLARSRINIPRPRFDFTDPRQTALLVVGRGAAEPRVILAMEDFVEKLKGVVPFGHVLHCFAEVSPPFIPAGFNRCIDLGATTIVVFPFVLFGGGVYRKICKQADVMRERYLDLIVRTTDYFGVDPLLCDIIAEEVTQTLPVTHA